MAHDYLCLKTHKLVIHILQSASTMTLTNVMHLLQVQQKKHIHSTFSKLKVFSLISQKSTPQSQLAKTPDTTFKGKFEIRDQVRAFQEGIFRELSESIESHSAHSQVEAPTICTHASWFPIKKGQIRCCPVFMSAWASYLCGEVDGLVGGCTGSRCRTLHDLHRLQNVRHSHSAQPSGTLRQDQLLARGRLW